MRVVVLCHGKQRVGGLPCWSSKAKLLNSPSIIDNTHPPTYISVCAGCRDVCTHFETKYLKRHLHLQSCTSNKTFSFQRTWSMLAIQPAISSSSSMFTYPAPPAMYLLVSLMRAIISSIATGVLIESQRATCIASTLLLKLHKTHVNHMKHGFRKEDNLRIR